MLTLGDNPTRRCYDTERGTTIDKTNTTHGKIIREKTGTDERNGKTVLT
jgi:hypothetical protein